MKKTVRPINPEARRYRALSLLMRSATAARRSSGILFAFVSGIWVNAASDPEVQGFEQFILQIYDVSARSTAWLAIVPTAILLLLPAIRLILGLSLRRASFAIALSETMASVADEEVAPYSRGRIVWGTQIVLQSCPRIEEGWTPDEIEITKQPNNFFYPDSETPRYQKWLRDKSNQYVRDGTSLRLTEDPASFTDDKSLRLCVQATRFADAMYFTREISASPNERRDQVKKVLSGKIDFPHSLCLHSVVATTDGWILVTRRSLKVAYHPGSWSCSIEEQLAVRDFEGTGGRVAKRWADRMLNEELGLRESELAGTDIRYLALFLEADKINVGVAGLITLTQDRRALESIIAARPRQDYEFSDWRFLQWNALAAELIRPTEEYHPSSGLRMFLAGLARFGVYEFGVQLSREAAKRGKERRGGGTVIVPPEPPTG